MLAERPDSAALRTPVSADGPCPSCGGADGCRAGGRQAFVLCQRVWSPWPCEGRGWFHRLRDLEHRNGTVRLAG